MTRAFIALGLNDPVRAALVEEIERLRPLSKAVAWVPPQNLHVTLKFLGEESEERLAEVVVALGEVGAALAPFSLTIHGLGAFPGMERPRILWAGVAEGALEVRSLQGRIEAALERRGFARESRPWHPHLTIGRVFDERRWRRDAGPDLRAALARGATTRFGAVPIARVSLMRSDLSPAGARYRELRGVDLAGS